MTEEVKLDQVEETKVEEKEVVAVEPSPEEAKASQFGWVPKDEWVAAGNKEEEWRSAREFNDRGELYQSLHSTKRELKQTQATLSALQRHHQFVFEKAHQQALDELKREKRVAMRSEDFETVEALEEEIEKKQTDFQKEKEALVREQQAAAAVMQPHPDFQAWVGRNQWYTSDPEMKEDADAFGVVYMNKNPTAAPADVLRYVESRIRKQYSDKFVTRRAAPNAVKGVDKSNGAARKVADDFDMTETEREIMKDLVSTGVMTEAQYKAELKKAYKKG